MESSFDVVVIGAGIIGMTIARQFLLHSHLSVSVVDASVPCSGATGAGQGYIWMAHMTPGSETWDLVKRSHQLWHQLAQSILDQGSDPLHELGWKKTGSLLVGSNSNDLLKKRVEQLSEAGLHAEYLSSSQLQQKEPDLCVGFNSCAAFLPDDAQIDTRRTITYIQKENNAFASQGRYAEFFCDPAVRLIRSLGDVYANFVAFPRPIWPLHLSSALLRSYVTGEIEGIKTTKTTLHSRKAVILAAGCWSGSLMQELIQDSDVKLKVPVQPRKGVLLVVENCILKLNHALMEAGYIDHLIIPSQQYCSDHSQLVENSLSVSMGVTIDANGHLLIGTSREFAGFNTETDMEVVSRIWKRAAEFFPALKQISHHDSGLKWKARVGLRPYMADGKPVIGNVPQMPKLYLATGHEGKGISMALGTAEMVVDMIMNNPAKVDPAPFAAQRRCTVERKISGT